MGDAMTNDELGELLRGMRDEFRAFRDEMRAFQTSVEDRLVRIDARFDHLEATIALGFEGQAIMREAFDRRFDAADQAHREQFGLLQAVARQTTGRLRQLEGH